MLSPSVVVVGHVACEHATCVQVRVVSLIGYYAGGRSCTRHSLFIIVCVCFVDTNARLLTQREHMPQSKFTLEQYSDVR